MRAKVGDFDIFIGAEEADLLRGFKKSGQAVDGFERKFKMRAASIARVGAGIVATVGAIGVGLATATGRAARTAKEIQNLSSIANASAVQFQRYAAAAKTVGIEQDKLADILKDVNDRVGDFLATGGGPMADFFEKIAPKVGVTADQFARLSGPEALQLYVSSLERANLTQGEMTFYMEAMASDATALLPLLQRNGAAMQELGDKAERLGHVMSDAAVRGGAELDDKLQDIAKTMSIQMSSAILQNADEISDLADLMQNTLSPAALTVAGDIGTVAGALGSMADEIGAVVGRIEEFASKIPGLTTQIKNIAAYGPLIGPLVGTLKDFDSDAALANQGSGGRNNSRTGSKPELGRPNPIIDIYDVPDPVTLEFGGLPILENPGGIWPGVDVRSSDGGGNSPLSSGGGGGASLAPTGADLELMRERFATATEIAQEAFERDLETLREFRDQKLITEQEFNQREEQLTEDHHAKLRKLERQAQAARLQAVAGMFGDLGSLMQSENDKLFKIGKAAKIAEAVVSGYKAAVEAWEKGMSIGGPGLAATFTAASLARTGALIASMQSQSSGAGGGGGGAVATGGAAATPAVAEPATYIDASFVGEGPISQSSMRDFFEFLNEHIENGGRIAGITVAGAG